MKTQIIINAITRTFLTLGVVLSIFAVAAYAQPENDNFANAEVLGGINVSADRHNFSATKQAGEPDHDSNPGGRSVWFKWTAPMDRLMAFSTTRSVGNVDTIVAVYRGTDLAALNYQASANDVSVSNRRSFAIFPVTHGVTYYIAVEGSSSHGSPPVEGWFKLDIHPFFPFQAAEHDGDGKTDLALFRASNSTFYIDGSTTDFHRRWGTTGDIPVNNFTSFYNGSPTVFRPSNGTWYQSIGDGSTTSIFRWGAEGDIPVTEAFGGFFKSIPTVFRPSTGTWYMLYNESTGQHETVQFGQAGDIPVPGQYTPDRVADIAVFRPSNGVWYILERFGGQTPNQVRVVEFGQPGDRAVPGDYDGDGILDQAIFRPSTGDWWVLRSSDNQQHAFRFGLSTDIPVTGDFDGDGIFDFAVFRWSNGNWYIRNSSDGSVRITKWGISGDIPVTSNYR